MEIRFLEIAQVEFDEAVEYYNSESPGLGEEFLLETLKAIERIKLFSNAWHSVIILEDASCAVFHMELYISYWIQKP